MDIIVLDDPGRGTDPARRAVVRFLGTLHAARPRDPGSGLPVSFTLCGEPTGRMDRIGPRTAGPGSPVYPPDLEGEAAMCRECERLAQG